MSEADKIRDILEGKQKAFTVFEDDKCLAVLHDQPATQGHIILFPKEPHPIIETCSDALIGHLFNIANKISTIVFEKLNAQGTNILISNGIAAGQEFGQFTINILPRWQNDGLNLEWTPKKPSEDEMSTAALLLNEHTKDIGIEEEKATEVIEEKPEETEQIKVGDEENYLIKQLERLP